MLHWQQVQKLLDSTSTFFRIFLISLLGHLVVLFVLLFVYKGMSEYAITISKSLMPRNTPICFIPLHKSLMVKSGKPRVLQKAAGRMGNSFLPANAKTAVVPLTPLVGTKKASGVKNKKASPPSQVKAASKKVASVKKLVDKPSPSKKALAASSAVKEIVPPTPSKKKPIVKEEKKSTVKKAQEPDPVTPQQAAAVENTSPAPQVNPVIPESALAEISHDAAAETTFQDTMIYIGQQEMDQLRTQDYIQQEIIDHWHPPVGIKSDVECVLKLVINFQGEIEKVIIEKSSSMLLFDGAAKRACAHLRPPAWAHGKELKITFKA